MESLRAETILPVWTRNCLVRPNNLEYLGRTIMLVTEGLNEIERKGVVLFSTITEAPSAIASSPPCIDTAARLALALRFPFDASMKSSIFLAALLCLCSTGISFGSIPWPKPSMDPLNPGSKVYPFRQIEESKLDFGRRVRVLYPAGLDGRKIPLIVFAHGHAAPYPTYRTTFHHLARKGFGVLYVGYDKGWQDRDFGRMTLDYLKQVDTAVRSLPWVDPTKILFSGHSNGAYVALMAAGRASSEQRFSMVRPQALVLFATAGFPKELVKKIDPSILATLVVGDRDSRSLIENTQAIYQLLPSHRKQAFLMQSYLQTNPQVLADHGFVRTLDWSGPRVNPIHYFGSWKLLGGTAQDLVDRTKGTNRFVYGSESTHTGIPGFEHIVKRSFPLTSPRKGHL